MCFLMTKTQLLMRIARLESTYGGTGWYQLRHWDQEIEFASNSLKALQVLAEEGYIKEISEHPHHWYRLTAKGKATLQQQNDE